MIVMKFGGSSLESPEAISRVCGIVKSHLPQHPVVVVSAIGKTTNQLLAMADQAAEKDGFQARKTLDGILDTHFQISGDLVRGRRLEALEWSLRKSFRELYGIIHDLCEAGQLFTVELSDQIASFGERLSSEIVAAALLEEHVPVVHVDSRDFIRTDDHHGSASPLLTQTYARLRRSIPPIASDVVVVMGGFIGTTEAGVTTTLGRGGSDLTASLVGAGIGAQEVQIWTDVDGMLTCDPRVLKSVHRLRLISFEEASALARAGAKVLHPDTIEPARRQQIPVTIRNSRRPELEGTCISAIYRQVPDGVKAIALKENLTVLEVFSKEHPSGPELRAILNKLCFQQGIEPGLLCASKTSVFLGLTSATRLGALDLGLKGYVEVHLRTEAAVITLVGADIPALRAEVGRRARTALRNVDVDLLPAEARSFTVQMIVPQFDCRRCCDRLHREFFAHINRTVFAPIATERSKLEGIVETPLAIANKESVAPVRFGLRRRLSV